MSIRLLKKQDIDLAKSNERAREVAEGLKVSRRVDNLRELAAREEETLEMFRVQTLSNIQEEISGFVASREHLRDEVANLENKFAKMLPDMAIKREDLNKLAKQLKEKEKEVVSRFKEVNLQEIDIAIALKEAEDSRARSTTHEERIKELQLRASQERLEAQDTLHRSQKIQESALISKEAIEKSLFLKEQNIEKKEKEIILQEEENKRFAKELSEDKIRVADREATLERSLERLKKHRLG